MSVIKDTLARICRPRRLWAAAAFAAFVALAGMWSLPPIDRDEARFAQASAQMLESGDFIVIRFQDQERNKKPAGIYWLQAASASLFSDVERREIWAYRIPSLIGAVLAAVFTFLSAQRLYDQRTAFLSAMLISAAPLVAAEASIAKTDSFLLGLICIAQFALIEIYARMQEGCAKGVAWPLLFWLAQGAGVLIKGPIAPLVSLLTGLGLSFKTPRIDWLARLRPLLGAVILTCLIAPWAIAIGDATDGRFFSEAMAGDMLSKIGSAQESHDGLPGFHLLLVWFLFWPAAALLPGGLLRAWRERDQWQMHFLLSWVIPGWIVFELTATKLPHYVLPLYPALAIIAAREGAQQLSPDAPFVRPGAALYGFVSLAAAGLVAAFATLFPSESLIGYIAAGMIGLGGLGVAALFWQGRAYKGGLVASVLAAFFAWTMLSGILPGVSALQVSPRIAAALEDAGRHPLKDNAKPVALAGYSEPSAVFLLGTETILTSGDEAARLLEEGRVSAVVVNSGEETFFLSKIALDETPVRELAVIDGLNYSNGERVSLSIYVRDAQNRR